MERKNNMNHQTNPPTSNAGAINELVKAAVHSHRIILRVLTTAAFVFGFVAIAASMLVASLCLHQWPWQSEILKDLPYPKTVDQAKPNTEPAEDRLKRIERIIHQEAFMTRMASTEATGVALAVSVLGLGTLILLTVVILNRRIALNQINNSLAQISNQLRELQAGRGGP
jgi:uncharacterized membrane protein